MKNLIYSISICLLFLAGCTGLKTTSTGIDNDAYLEIIGKLSDYKGGVEITLDDKITFKGKVNKNHVDRPKGEVYAISTGNHTIMVSYNSKVLFKKQIFVSSQETKKIILP
jgi:hypothetical protein